MMRKIKIINDEIIPNEIIPNRIINTDYYIPAPKYFYAENPEEQEEVEDIPLEIHKKIPKAPKVPQPKKPIGAGVDVVVISKDKGPETIGFHISQAEAAKILKEKYPDQFTKFASSKSLAGTISRELRKDKQSDYPTAYLVGGGKNDPITINIVELKPGTRKLGQIKNKEIDSENKEQVMMEQQDRNNVSSIKKKKKKRIKNVSKWKNTINQK